MCDTQRVLLNYILLILELCSQQKQDWELSGSDHGLLIAKVRLKLKKVGKTTTIQFSPVQ